MFLELELIHGWMCAALAHAGATIDAVHHRSHEVQPPCSCRKPKPGLLFDASCTHDIDLLASWMIGDSDIDVRAVGTARRPCS
jgi:D-glycero-D-manno-heptose 1,7-bisphosphate phosphatase